jgi:hypothetical protein
MPIKVVEKFSHLQKQVITGVGVSSTVVAIPITYVKDHFRRKADQKDVTWFVLLDSGSDGDIYFRHPSKKVTVPTRKRLTPMTWRTSKGTFQTKD